MRRGDVSSGIGRAEATCPGPQKGSMTLFPEKMRDLVSSCGIKYGEEYCGAHDFHRVPLNFGEEVLGLFHGYVAPFAARFLIDYFCFFVLTKISERILGVISYPVVRQRGAYDDHSKLISAPQ